ncbi:unnamed protein product [Ixodes persulcatus]
MEVRSGKALLVDEACQTSLNLAHMMDELKKTELRLKAQITLQNSALQNSKPSTTRSTSSFEVMNTTCRSENSGCCWKLRRKVIRLLCLLKLRSLASAKRNRSTLKAF